MKRQILVGSRKSPLAVIQAESVIAELKKVSPETEFKLEKIVTEGELRGHVPLRSFSGSGVFVKKLEEALLEDRIDLAVHSLKDLPTELSPGLTLAAVTQRADPRDVLVGQGKKLAELAPGSTIGTGSPRRAVQLLAYRPDLRVKEIRGNIQTRMRRVFDGEFDGVIAAAPALLRSGLEERITQYLPLEHFLPQVGQGALGIEIRVEDEEIIELVQRINHEPTWKSVSAERAFLRTLGGGCRAPIAALARMNGEVIKIEGMKATSFGLLRSSEEGIVPEEVASKLAQKLLEMEESSSISGETSY